MQLRKLLVQASGFEMEDDVDIVDGNLELAVPTEDKPVEKVRAVVTIVRAPTCFSSTISFPDLCIENVSYTVSNMIRMVHPDAIPELKDMIEARIKKVLKENRIKYDCLEISWQ